MPPRRNAGREATTDMQAGFRALGYLTLKPTIFNSLKYVSGFKAQTKCT